MCQSIKRQSSNQIKLKTQRDFVCVSGKYIDAVRETRQKKGPLALLSSHGRFGAESVYRGFCYGKTMLEQVVRPLLLAKLLRDMKFVSALPHPPPKVTHPTGSEPKLLKHRTNKKRCWCCLCCCWKLAQSLLVALLLLLWGEKGCSSDLSNLNDESRGGKDCNLSM